MAFNTIFTKNDQVAKQKIDELQQVNWTRKQVMPVSMRLPGGQWWHFPTEPLVSISGGNKIVKRNVAKSEKRGSIKERWTKNDYSINIQGTFRHPDPYTYPSDAVGNLELIISQNKSIEVLCELFQMLDIHQIVVESYSFPFSKGENVQNFSIEAYSDDLYELFIDVKDV